MSYSDLRGFRELQQLAYEGAEAVAATLELGVSEREAARRLRRWLTARGIQDWLHTPFAWFGDRTAFRGFRMGLGPNGAKFEEILVVTPDDAFWLDDLPHVRKWARA